AARPAAAQPAAALPDSLVRRVDAVFAALGPQTPGCAVGVRRDGAVALEKGYGSAELEHDVPFTAATVSEAGSVTKQVVALAVRLLERDGKLSLDDDVRRWVPELPDLGGRITLRHLIQHTSGLRDQWALIDLVHPRAQQVVQTVPEVLQLIARQRALNFAPGAEYLYSNSGYTLLAVTIERASGAPLPRFAAERIFAPLGMTRTSFRDDHTRIVKGRASAYAGTPERGFRLLMPEYGVVGSGGMLTTVGDLLRLEANYASGAVGGAALVAAMTDSATLADGRRIPYAYGLTNGTHRGVRTVSHGGSTAGYRAYLLRAPERRAAVTLLCNSASANPEALALAVADAALPDVFPASAPAVAPFGRAVSTRPRAELTPDRAAALAGDWRDSTTGEVVAVAATPDARLVFGAPRGAATDTLAPLGGTYHGSRRGAVRVAEGSAPRLHVALRDGNRLTLAPAAAPAPDAAARAAMVGRYRSAELDATFEVAARGDSLVLRRPRFPDAALRAETAGQFSAGGGMRVEVERGAILITNGRARRVRFERVEP
ncbi:serine hydrolase domain-containing protein, partial [Roseisolibacter sp. H3M3-2]|uniref:serine hydrolase domain-containing protein n=1 Tax=Roseisolibacter sp. H3M3-2 TaxID=3031323 RepID=UPI0023DCE134